MQCCLNTPRTTLHRSKSYAMLSERLCSVVLILLGHLCTGKTICNVVPEAPDNIAQEKSCSMLSESSWDNIEHVKTLCKNAREAPDNIAQEKFLFDVVLILLGQHPTDQSLLEDCPGGFK